LTGGVAHDLNNILGGILGSTEILGKYLRDEANAHKFYKLCVHSIQRGTELTKRLLTLSRKENEYFENIHLEGLIYSAIELYKTISKAGSEIKINFSDKKRFIKGNEALLETVILNLLINASHAMQNNGIITIKIIDLKEKYFQIEVYDHGVGMTQEMLDNIFKPYYTTKSPDEGTGMGLATALSIIEHHDGNITVESEPGEGSCFKVGIPKSIQGEDITIREIKSYKATYTENNVLNLDSSEQITKETVLIVDDEPDMREILSNFARDLGYKTLMADSGEQAIRFMEQNDSIGIVILDVIMPGMDGADCYEAIKATWPDVSILICSGYIPSDKKDKLLALGAKHILSKPFTRNSLKNSICALTGMPLSGL
jgi:CheY-like chemotaxis protein